jgi:indolepyruvate ferredoxin oxidoreductase alpha subunit
MLDVIVTGDIGCYSLGFAPPYNRMDTIICMGAAIGAMHGMEKAGVQKPVVGVIGDSTFLHSGVTGLMDVVYNKGCGTVIILDNRTTAMTGHQEHPATGKTLMGEDTYEVKFEDIARACGVKRVITIDPYDLDKTFETVKEEIEAKEPSVIITARSCVLLERKRVSVYVVDIERCKSCMKCVKLGCPAIETIEVDGKKKVRINDVLCIGCGMCHEVCPFGAISLEK